MLHHYSIGYRELLTIPAKTFWMLHKNVDRMAAEEDIRALQVAAYSQSGETIKSMMTDLQAQMGRVIEMDQAAAVKAAAERDDNTRHLLKELAEIGDLDFHGH